MRGATELTCCILHGHKSIKCVALGHRGAIADMQVQLSCAPCS